jgi:SAM-dependent methyltransferase
MSLKDSQYIPSSARALAMSRRVAALYWSILGPDINEVLDIGCGYGGFAQWKKNDTRVIGIDRDPLALRTARGYCEATYEIDLDKQNLPFETERFDGVLARDVLEHLVEPWNAVREIFRVLKPGKVAISSVPMPKPKVVWNDYTHVRGFTKFAFKKLFEDSGFLIRDLYPIVGFKTSEKLRITRFLPYLMKLPGANFVGVSYQMIAVKPGRGE